MFAPIARFSESLFAVRKVAPFVFVFVFAIEARAAASKEAVEARPPLSYRLDRASYELEIQTLTTDANYTSAGGERENLPAGYGYQRQAMRNRIAYRWWPRTLISVGFDYVRAQSESPTETNTLMGVPQLQLGGHVDLRGGRWYAQPGLEITVPLQRISSNRRDVLLDEGALEIRPHWRTLYLIGSLGFDGDVGLVLRDQERAQLADYRLTGLVNWRAALLGVGVRGYVTILDDKFTNDPDQRLRVVERANGRSYAFYTVNPSQAAYLARLEYVGSDEWGIFIELDQTFNGRNAAESRHVFVGVRTRLAPATDPTLRPARDRRLERFQFNDGAEDSSNRDAILPDPEN
jgi:hypothetical protein